MEPTRASREDSGITHSVEGQRPPIVLVPGLGASAQSTWGAVTKILAGRQAVVCPDLRGAGETDSDRVTLEDLAGDVLAAAADANLRSFDLVGFSLGAAVAVQVAAERPESVRCLILVAAPSVRPTGRSALQFGLWKRLFEQDEEAFSQLWLLTGFSAEFVSAIPATAISDAARFPIEGAAGAQCALAAELDYREALKKVEAATLILSCSDDFINPYDPELTNTLSRRVRTEQAELSSGHMVVLQSPQVLASAIDTFSLSVE